MKTLTALLIGLVVFSAGAEILNSSKNTLNLQIPFEGLKGRYGRVRVILLDPDDQVVGKTDRFVFIKRDYYSVPMKIKLKKEVKDYDLLRVKVNFKKSERIYSMFQLKDRMIVRILGQNNFIKGTPIKYRIIARNQRTNAPISGASVEIALNNKKNKETVFTGKTDRAGICNARFNIPEELNECNLHFEVTSKLGKDSYDTKIKFKTGNLTYLVTDKPIYQPGQTIHIRTLSLHRPELSPVKNGKLIFEIEDSKGNKVYKKATKTDKFGVAHTKFTLADEVNFGDYTLRAILEKEKTEKTVKVKRYVLPKFKIESTTDKEFYLPGEKLSGDIDVQYFFGKPVTDARVKITTYRYDIGFQKEATIEGKTDNNGKYHYIYELPDYFVGEPLEKGNAFIRLDIEVTDKANHTEKISVKKKVVRNLIVLSIVPEGGNLKPNLKNRVYVLSTYPDGTPCLGEAIIEVEEKKLSAKTDDSGIAEFSFTPTESNTEIKVNFTDNKGETAEIKKSFNLDLDRDQIILRLKKGIYKIGESLNLSFLTTKKTGRAYLDIIKDNQTFLTKSVRINNGQGQLSIPITPGLSGSIWLHAYIVNPGGDIIRDTRFCYIHPANDLLIKITPDKKEYLPGEDGKLRFRVTDKNGKPRVAALCVAVVDEAVFAVSELHPGLERVYFLLEKQILKPRYEIHGFTPIEIVEKPEINPRIENVMFSTLVPKNPFPVNYTTPQNVNKKIIKAYYKRLTDTRDKIYKALNKYHSKHNEYPRTRNAIATLIEEKLLNEKDIKDPWGRRYKITCPEEYFYYFQIASAGPDGVFDTEDDLKRWPGGFRAGRGVLAKEEMLVAPALKVNAAVPGPVKSEDKTKRKIRPAKEEPRIREFFPETFIFEPALITGTDGKADLSLTMPDAITTWRVSSFASSMNGELGSTASRIRVFQDFFIDIDLPVALTQGDEISIPVAIYNYLPHNQKIKLALQPEDWFDILNQDEITKELKKDEVSVAYFPIRVKKIGNFTILVKAYGETKSDAIKRRIQVLPDGKRFENIISDRLSKNIVKEISFPEDAIPEANSLILKLYPGIFSQVVEGLDKLLRVPYGCFEQTSSVTYPNILILNYLRQTEQIKPDIEMTAEEYISLGYQRLLSFEVEGGGFSWFGDAPANKVLTAYGLMEFNDMAKVHEIDERLIQRTANWLKSKQNKDGSWSPDKQYLHAESWSKIQKNEILPTAYILWSLGEIGESDQSITRGLSFLEKNLNAAKDPYMLALVANAFVANQPKSKITVKVLKKLIGMAKEKDDAVWWESDIPSITFSKGKGADIEATGLAAYALVKSGKFSDIATRALTYLIRSKNASGMWHTTQGTVICLRALVAALGGMTEDIDARVIVTMNGKEIKRLKVNKENADLMHQIDLNEGLKQKNRIEIALEGKGNFLYEICQSYYLPWKIVPRPQIPGFEIAVDYDRTELRINDLVKVDVQIKLRRQGTAQLVMVDLGIPPGFEVQTPDLDELVGKKIQKYTITPRQLIIYLDKVSSNKPVKFAYHLRAKYPIRAKVSSSRVYEYYNTNNQGVEPPIEMKVKL